MGGYQKFGIVNLISIYFDLLNTGKPTPLFFTFTEGVEFFWGVQTKSTA
jgi:hypothetical protein